jgi:hypothetical protein
MVVCQPGKVDNASSVVQSRTVTYAISVVTSPPIANSMDFAFLLIVQLKLSPTTCASRGDQCNLSYASVASELMTSDFFLKSIVTTLTTSPSWMVTMYSFSNRES